MVCLAGLPCLFFAGRDTYQQTNWYHYRSADSLVDEALSDATTRFLAWEEIERRSKLKSLPKHADERLIDAALVEHAKPPVNTPTSDLALKYLSRRFAADALTTSQVDQYLDALFDIHLAARSKVTHGDHAVCEFYFGPRARAAPDTLLFDVRYQLFLDGTLLHENEPSGPTTLAKSRLMGGVMPVPVSGLGPHVLSAKVSYEILRRSTEGDQADLTVIRAREFSPQAPFDVIDPAVEQPISFVKEPSADQITKAVRVRLFENTIVEAAIHGEVELKRPPVNVAFEVFARSGDVERRIGQATAGPSRWVTVHLRGNLNAMPTDHRVDVVLRSSRKAAAATLDLYQIWEGEIVIPDVPIENGNPDRPSESPDATGTDLES